MMFRPARAPIAFALSLVALIAGALMLAPQAQATTPVLPPAASRAAVPAPDATAQALVRRLNGAGHGGWVSGSHVAATDPAFTRLMDDNGRLAGQGGGGPDLDYDPVCQCQDTGGHFVLTALTRRGDLADMHIRLGGGAGAVDPPINYTIVLRWMGNAWRIYDVVETTDGSIRTRMTRHNACLRAPHTDASLERCFAGH